MKLGFIGLGKMGKPISKNLLKSGYELTVYDINMEAVRDLGSLGAKATKSARNVAETSDFILTCLNSSEALEAVVLSEEGVLEGARNGSTFIDLGTTDSKTIRKIAKYLEQKGVEMLDAPISGGVEGAEAGSLTIMVGGKREIYEKSSEIFRCIGENVYYLGELGCGTIVKIVNNLMSLCNLATMVEGFALGVKAGIDAKTLYEIIKNSFGTSKVLEASWPRRIARGDYEPGFRISLARKDLGFALNMSKDLGVPLFMTNTADQIFALAQAKGLKEREATSIALVFENLLGIKLGEN